jgi:SIR2-like domain
VQAIINYNYDDLLEQNLRHQNVRCTTVLSGSQRIPDGSLPSYHVHGLVGLGDYVEYLQSSLKKPMSAKGNFVFSEDEYHAEYSDPYKWSNMTQISHLGRYIGLFVGLSMQDPNLRRLIDVTHKQYPENYNFAILPRPVSLASSKDSKHTVLRNMFEDVEGQSFARIGVKVLWVDSFEKIAPLIRSVVEDGRG